MEKVTPEDDFPGRLLHQAALWDNAELLEDLLRGEQIAHINSQDSWGRTALHAAATTDNSRCLGILLQAGADPNIPCGSRGDNRTPLHMSSEHGYISNVKQLLLHGADLVARDNSGLTSLDIAEKSEHIECMLVLKQTAASRLTLGPNQPHIRWVPGIFHQRQGFKADQSPPCSAEVKKGGTIPPLLHICMA